MRILIFGGTGFLGRHIVKTALDRGHTLTLFNRGRTLPELFPKIEQIHGDRDVDLSPLHHQRWDAVMDVSGRHPSSVGAAADLLKNATDHYTFISSISVYADFSQPGLTEESPVEQLSGPLPETVAPESYGALKALSEQAVNQALPDRALIIRPGLIVGPYDTTDRFTYWPHRIAQGGQVLVPDLPDRPVQFIDARDLSSWAIHMAENRQTGTYNAIGPRELLSMGRFFEICQQVSQSNTQFRPVSEAFLLQQKVEPYSEIPLWVPSDMRGFGTVDRSRAIEKGLTYRPLEETVRDTWDWDAGRPASENLKAGLSKEREQNLLQKWAGSWS